MADFRFLRTHFFLVHPVHYLHNIYSGVVTRSWARLAPAPGAARVVVECVSLDTVHSAADSLTVQLQCEYRVQYPLCGAIYVPCTCTPPLQTPRPP